MATEPLKIKWLPQPLEVTDEQKALTIKDPLPVIATLLDLTPPSEAEKAKHGGLKILEEFSLLLQHFLRIEMHEQLSRIHEMAINYQEANSIQVGYLQKAVFNMTMHIFDIRQSIVAALETIPAPEKETTEGSSEPMDWEWTPKPLPVPNLAEELENKIKKGKLKAHPAEDPRDAADGTERTRRGGTVLPPSSQGLLGSSQNTGRKCQDRKSVV